MNEKFYLNGSRDFLFADSLVLLFLGSSFKSLPWKTKQQIHSIKECEEQCVTRRHVGGELDTPSFKEIHENVTKRFEIIPSALFCMIGNKKVNIRNMKYISTAGCFCEAYQFPSEYSY